MDSATTIKTLFASVQVLRKALNAHPEPSSSAYQDDVHTAINKLEDCRILADRISLFSPNEAQDDIASGDFQYLLIDHYLGDMIMRTTAVERKVILKQSQEAYERYLHRLDTYQMLSKDDRRLLERFVEGRDEFTLMASNDASARRDTKIRRYKQENELRSKLEHLANVPNALQGDDAALRELYLAEIDLATHHTFHALDMIAQELKILTLMPKPSLPKAQDLEADHRERNGQRKDPYSDRLDPSLTQLMKNGKAGPILSKDGKPLKPFTLLDSRQRLRDGVFRPDHSLPTMTIDEYLDEEKRRGGMIDGGGEASGRSAPVDEDNMELADQETMKAREWDEFTEANAKGSGNTINRG